LQNRFYLETREVEKERARKRKKKRGSGAGRGVEILRVHKKGCTGQSRD